MKPDQDPPEDTGGPTLVSGRLMEVNWASGTAELHRFMDSVVPLRFGRKLNEEMGRCGGKYVQVWGRGRISDDDQWIVIDVAEIAIPKMHTAEEILNDPNPKIFDPAEVIRASEPFDVDDFVRMIHADRDNDIERPDSAGRESSG